MDTKKLLALFLIALVGGSMPVLGAYTANYTVSDVDDIVIDIAATAMVEVKDDMPTLIDLGVLYLIITLLLLVVSGVVALFYLVPKKLGVGKKRV